VQSLLQVIDVPNNSLTEHIGAPTYIRKMKSGAC